jgi:hypothetical protein
MKMLTVKLAKRKITKKKKKEDNKSEILIIV